MNRNVQPAPLSQVRETSDKPEVVQFLSTKGLSESSQFQHGQSSPEPGGMKVPTKIDTDYEIRSPLSKRQEDCLRGVLALKSAKEIARDLGISPGGVEKHLKACREKFGVTTTADAARLFSLNQHGRESPPWRFSDLAQSGSTEQQGGVLKQRPLVAAEGDETGAPTLDQPLSPRQTLLAIAVVSFVSIVGLLLLVACADGIRSLVSR